MILILSQEVTLAHPEEDSDSMPEPANLVILLQYTQYLRSKSKNVSK